jgi:hypothetical protein
MLWLTKPRPELRACEYQILPQVEKHSFWTKRQHILSFCLWKILIGWALRSITDFLSYNFQAYRFVKRGRGHRDLRSVTTHPVERRNMSCHCWIFCDNRRCKIHCRLCEYKSIYSTVGERSGVVGWGNNTDNTGRSLSLFPMMSMDYSFT